MTVEERTARLEGEIGHMATKADIETVRDEFAAVRDEFGKLSATLAWRMILLVDAFQAVGIGALIQRLPAPNHTDTSKSHLTMRNSQTTLDQKPKLL